MSCASSGHVNPERAKLCLECGAALATDRPPREPRAYTPKHLAGKILQSKSALAKGSGRCARSSRSGADARTLCEWCAELAAVLGDDVTRAQLLGQAQQGYDEIGVPLHAPRLGEESGC